MRGSDLARVVRLLVEQTQGEAEGMVSAGVGEDVDKIEKKRGSLSIELSSGLIKVHFSDTDTTVTTTKVEPFEVSSGGEGANPIVTPTVD